MKKQNQLGMNPSTASARLVKDILYKLVVDTGQNNCHHCGSDMSRDTFSIEHKTPWLDSEDPLGLYFDLENISFSHLKCNVGARRTKPTECGTVWSYQKGCRCDECRKASSQYQASRYTPGWRQERYERTGK